MLVISVTGLAKSIKSTEHPHFLNIYLKVMDEYKYFTAYNYEILFEVIAVCKNGNKHPSTFN